MMDFREIPWFATADRNQRWLVGVSGGADSVALLRMLMEAGFTDLVACHLNHGLRGDESDEDAEFVRELAAELGAICAIGRLDVRARMVAGGESLETAARHARHDFFAKCAVKHGCSSVLLAHHADDQAETVLWNLLRGSHGLKGMRDFQEITTDGGAVLEVQRPLLGLRRSELVRWLEERGFRWREDSSNAEPIAIRNRLRNEALPLLEEISGRDAVTAFCRGAQETRELADLEAWALAKANELDPQGRLHVPALRELPVALQRAAFASFLKGAGVPGVNGDLLRRIAALLDSTGSPAVNLAGGFHMRRREGRMFLERDR